MKMTTSHKKISLLRHDELYEPKSRIIAYLVDLKSIFEEVTHIPGQSLTLTYLFPGLPGKDVSLFVTATAPSNNKDGVGFFDYFEKRFEPYFRLEQDVIIPEKWSGFITDFTHTYAMVPSVSDYELLSPRLPVSLNPLKELVQKVQMLNLKIAIQVTVKSLNNTQKKELLQLLPIMGTKQKLQNSEIVSLPRQLEWINGTDNTTMAKEFHNILGYNINVLSSTELSQFSGAIIKHGLLGDSGDQYVLQKRSAWQGNSDLGSGFKADDVVHGSGPFFLDASNGTKIFQIPLALKVEHYGLSIENIPLLIDMGAEPMQNGILLGESNRAGLSKGVIISEDNLTKHCYISGKTGCGKSTLMLNMINNIAKLNNQAVFLLDPHGDLAKDVVKHLSAKDLKRTVYIDFAADSTPGLNMLDTDERGLDFAIGELESYFLRLFGPEIFGPRIQDAFRNLLTLLGLSKSPETLCDLLWAINLHDGQVLTQFKKIAEKSKRFGLLLFLEHILTKVGGDGSLKEMTAYFRAKFSVFSDSILRHNLGQQLTTLPFESLIKEKKIVLLNLNKGQLSTRHSGLLGTIITTMLFQTAIHTGAAVEEAERSPFAIFIDECQNYISPSIADILAEARKFKVSLILASQHLDQLNDGNTSFLTRSNLQKAIIGNVGSLISFRSSHQNSKVLADELGGVVKPGQISSLPNYSAIAKLESHNQLSMPTMLTTFLPKPRRKSIEKVKKASEQQYCRPRKEVDEEINARIKAKLGWSDVPENPVEEFFS